MSTRAVPPAQARALHRQSQASHPGCRQLLFLCPWPLLSHHLRDSAGRLCLEGRGVSVGSQEEPADGHWEEPGVAHGLGQQPNENRNAERMCVLPLMDSLERNLY